VSGHCPQCGNYHEEDDDRVCSRCASSSEPTPEPQGDHHRRVVLDTFVRLNIKSLPDEKTDLYPLAKQLKRMGLYSQKTSDCDIASSLLRIYRRIHQAEQKPKPTQAPIPPRRDDQYVAPTIRVMDGVAVQIGGLTLRDYFAGQALAGLLANDSAECAKSVVVNSQGVVISDHYAARSYVYADAMLDARDLIHKAEGREG